MPHAQVLHNTWNAFYAIQHWDYKSVNILNKFRFVPVWTGSQEVGKLCEERISGCEWVLFLDWGTAAHMGWGRRKAACWAPRTGPGPRLWGGHWETIGLQWRGVLPDTSVFLVPTVEAFKIHNQNFSSSCFIIFLPPLPLQKKYWLCLRSYIQEQRGLVCQRNFRLYLSSARIQKIEDTVSQTFVTENFVIIHCKMKHVCYLNSLWILCWLKLNLKWMLICRGKTVLTWKENN